MATLAAAAPAPAALTCARMASARCEGGPGQLGRPTAAGGWFAFPSLLRMSSCSTRKTLYVTAAACRSPLSSSPPASPCTKRLFTRSKTQTRARYVAMHCHGVTVWRSTALGGYRGWLQQGKGGREIFVFLCQAGTGAAPSPLNTHLKQQNLAAPTAGP